MASGRTGKGLVVVVTGQVESAYFPSTPSLYVRCSWASAPSAGWNKIAGEDSISACCLVPSHGRFVIDLPISATFKGSTPFRWPQIVFSCYGLDSFGHDVCRGYGSCPIPSIPGRHTREVACFTPQPSSTIQNIVGWISGRRAEFVDPAIVALEEGREVTRVSTRGILHVSLNIIIRGSKQMGYDVITSTMSRPSDFPLPEFNIGTSTVQYGQTQSGQVGSKGAETQWEPPTRTQPPPITESIQKPNTYDDEDRESESREEHENPYDPSLAPKETEHISNDPETRNPSEQRARHLPPLVPNH